MTDLSLAVGASVDRASQGVSVSPRGTGARPAARQGRDSDSVELSAQARALAELAKNGEIRADLVERVKKQIDAGTYETEDKLDRAAAALAQRLGG